MGTFSCMCDATIDWLFLKGARKGPWQAYVGCAPEACQQFWWLAQQWAVCAVCAAAGFMLGALQRILGLHPCFAPRCFWARGVFSGRRDIASCYLALHWVRGTFGHGPEACRVSCHERRPCSTEVLPRPRVCLQSVELLLASMTLSHHGALPGME